MTCQCCDNNIIGKVRYLPDLMGNMRVCRECYYANQDLRGIKTR